MWWWGAYGCFGKIFWKIFVEMVVGNGDVGGRRNVSWEGNWKKFRKMKVVV